MNGSTPLDQLLGNLLTDVATGKAHSFALDLATTRDLRPEVVDEQGRIRVLPAAYWATTTLAERALVGNRIGAYVFPTTELIDYLRGLIGDRSAIEIGSGNGVIADALGIPATDNKMQEKEPYRSTYLRSGQQPVNYGPNVVEMHASRAVRHYKPDVVLGCWTTHKFDPQHPERHGNEIGVDELDVLQHCREFIFVGIETQHEHSRLWTRPHQKFYPDWLYSRATSGGRQFVAVIKGFKK